MTKRSHHAAARYANRSGKGKRKRLPKSHPPSEAKLASQQLDRSAVEREEGLGEPPASPPVSDGGANVVAATYAYVVSDLKRTGIIAGALFALLIVLAIVFG